MRFTKQALWLMVAIVVLFSSSPALAQTIPTAAGSQGLNVEISPLPILLTAKPGTAISTNLRVRNTGTIAETLKLSLKTFDAVGPSGRVVLKEPTPSDNFTKWVSFSQPVLQAPPGQWQTVKMNINVPASAAFGYYYAVQFELANPPKPQPGSARLQGAVVIFVLLNVQAPGAQRKISVTSFKADHSTYEFLPANFSIQVHNTGNVHTAPHGNIFIKRGSKQVAAVPINPTEGMVLPGSNRIFSNAWDDGFPVYSPITNDGGQPVKDSKGQPKRQLKWDFSKVAKLRFGHYTANLLLVYNDGQRDIPITGSLSFWVIPWRLLAVIVSLILLVGSLITYVIILRRRLKHSGKIYSRSPRHD